MLLTIIEKEFKMKKLYLIILQNSAYCFYVMAENETEAYQKVKNDLDDLKYGLLSDTQLNTIQLLAEEKICPDIEKKIKKLYL